MKVYAVIRSEHYAGAEYPDAIFGTKAEAEDYIFRLKRGPFESVAAVEYELGVVRKD
jgi:hypothetical protein